MRRDRFRRLVQRALADVPEPFRVYVRQVAVVVEREPSMEERTQAHLGPDGELFGLYVGTPLTERHDYHMVLPDRIVIYQGPHERHFAPSQLAEEIRRTVIHEVAHHFGIDDERLHELRMD